MDDYNTAKILSLASNKKINVTRDDPDFKKSNFQRPEDKKVDDHDASIYEMKDGDKGKSKVTKDMELQDKIYLELIIFCSKFPIGYEFSKDILVRHLIVGRLVDLDEDAKYEKVCTEVFDKLHKMEYIVPSGHDYSTDERKYKVGEAVTTFLQTQKQLSELPKFAKDLDVKESNREKVEHLSVDFKKMDRVKLDPELKKYTRLKTLFVHNCNEVDRLPRDIFLGLKKLKILNLSHARILELPSSFACLKELEILDVSRTPIGWLPETLCSFIYLDTLNLDGCLQLEGLPKGTSKLTNLRHLILDVMRVLYSMPSGIGKLTNLQTLSAFLVHEGNGVSQLKNMNKLKGSFRLLNLENVRTKEKGSEACLHDKVGLRKVELQWTDLREKKKNPCEEEIIESLRPPNSIEELKILFYSGGVLPPWICNPSFNVLVNIILYKCRYFCGLPSLGELPSLERLSIIENNEVVEIDGSFFGERTEEHPVAFPKLEKLSFNSMSKLKKWTGLKKGDFPSLRHLMIEYCPSLVGIPFLSHLESLLHLEINYCPNFSCLSKGGQPPPSQLESLMVKKSPKLKVQWKKWHPNARSPTIYIDNVQKL